ncbi:MAG TPA: acyl-CoA dehydrogenase family protein [Candidatus Tumulicola sp.]
MQREQLERDLSDGHLFGVWNTQDGNGVRIADAAGGFVLSGAKTWASGAGTITRALITAALPNGLLQMCLVPMDRVQVAIDRSAWEPMGMQASDSFSVSFDSVVLSAGDLIGNPGDYEAQPWFFGGALRFLAVHAGIMGRLEAETLAYLTERNRDSDTFQRVRAAQVRIAVQTSRQWLRTGMESWMRFDAEPSESNANQVLETVDMARVAIERAALDVIELVVRSVGARGLIEPLPFGHLIRDLQMYLRQPAPDAVVMRVGAAAFSSAAAACNASIASPTGVKG